MNADELRDRIESRGYWRIEIRPSEYEKERLEGMSELEQAIAASRVQLRGWDYPHLPRQGVELLGDHIQAGSSWTAHQELWRLYSSGQFVHLLGMREDWYDEEDFEEGLTFKPGDILSLASTLYTFTEIFVFAARLAARLKLGPSVYVQYGLFKLAGRRLKILEPGRAPLSDGRRASPNLGPFGRSITVPADELTLKALQLAVDETLRVYELFHWNPARASVAEEQRKFVEKRQI